MQLKNSVDFTLSSFDSALATLLDPIILSRHLSPVLPPGWGKIKRIQVRVLQYHPGSRCTVGLVIQSSSGSFNVIGKVYATDRYDVYQFMTDLRQAGFDSSAELSIPQPFAYLPELRLLLQDQVEGTCVKDIFLGLNSHERTETARQCARWLAHYHQIAPRSGTTLQLQDYLNDLERWSQRIARLGEPFTHLATELFERVYLTAPRLTRVEACAGHGSFNPTQIIVSGTRTIVFDWDGFDMADPNRDVARFVIALERLALGRLGSIRALDAEVSVFEETYGNQVRSHPKVNLAFYKAAISLQLAKYDVHHQVKHWRAKVKALLDEGLAVLAPQW